MEKLKYQINKYINSEGLLKTPAIYIKLLFNNIFNNIDSINSNINERLDNIKYCKNITYSELIALRDNSQLIPGVLYRIIDYITTTIQEGTKSANNQFDIIVTADSENTLNENARAIQHESESEGYNENIYNNENLENDFFVEWGITTEPNTGEDTLCIYKTDVTGLDDESEKYDSDYAVADFDDVFFYKGNYKYNGESFDVWLKYEIDKDGYYIEHAESNYFHYYLTTPIVENGSIKPELYDTDTLLFYEPFNAEYILSVDNSSPSGYFSNSNLNAWELKYTLDNDITRFVWADTENGKGVIYYMKDEYNNECPYDFKNIQFVRTSEWFSNNHTWYNRIFEYIPQEDKWFYTFSWINENGECEDLSIIGNTLYNDERYITGVFGNKILEYSNSFLYSDINNSLFALPGNIFVSSYLYDGATFYGCYSNTLGNNCYNNTFGNACYQNSFDNDCAHNSFSNNCYNNTFSNNCYQNSFGNYCTTNTFGNSCQDNTFGDECSSNTFGNNCCSNAFGNGCNSNTFGDYCNSNTFGNDCYGNSFGNNCSINSFGNYCNSNAFGDGCYSNTFEAYCTSNTFGNNCYDNEFGESCSSNTFGNEYHGNSFSNYCSSNSFGNNCYDNSFGNQCDFNMFGNGCELNTFGDNCYSNSFGNECSFNVFGNNCISNSFGNICTSNTFGNEYYSNTFGNTCAYNIISNSGDGVFENIKEYAYNLVRNNTFDNDVSFNNIYHQDTGYLQNYHITAGVSEKRHMNNMNVIDLGLNACDLPFKTTIAKKSNGEIVVYNEADLVPWTYISE